LALFPAAAEACCGSANANRVDIGRGPAIGGSRIRLLQGSTPPAAAALPGHPPQRRRRSRSRPIRTPVCSAFSAGFSAAIARAHGIPGPRRCAAADVLRGTERLQRDAIRGTHDIAPPAAATTAFRSHRRDRPLDMETP
jgi:hypothetical protein